MHHLVDLIYVALIYVDQDLKSKAILHIYPLYEAILMLASHHQIQCYSNSIVIKINKQLMNDMVFAISIGLFTLATLLAKLALGQKLMSAPVVFKTEDY